jgi:hypothetical protein
MRRPLFRALWMLWAQRSLWLPLAVLPGLQLPRYDSHTTGKADGVPPSGLDSIRRPRFRVSWSLLTQGSLWLPLAVLPGLQPPPKPAEPHTRQELGACMSGPVSSCLVPGVFHRDPTSSKFHCAGCNLPFAARSHKTWEVLPTNVGKISRPVSLPLRPGRNLCGRRCLGDALVGNAPRILGLR